MDHRLAALINSHWYLSQTAHDTVMAMLMAALKTPTPQALRSEANTANFHGKINAQATPYVNAERETWLYDSYPVKIGSTVVIPIMGVITQDDYFWGVPGTKTIASWYAKANADDTVTNIIELINSPGGQVFGTNELASLKSQISKPIITSVEGMACSAAYYIASTSGKIYATSPNVIVGSVGTMTTFVSFAKYFEGLGITVRDIYASTSPDKNNPSRQAEKGNDKPYQTEILDPMDAEFMAFVVEQRPGIDPEALKGKAVTAKEGLKLGLIDGITDLSSLLSGSTPPSSTNSSAINSQNPQTNTMKHLWMAIISLFGMVEPAKADGTEKTEAELATEAHTHVKQLQAQLTTANAALATKQAELTTVQGELTTAKAALADANTKIAAYEKLPQVIRSQARQQGNDPIPPIEEKDPEVEAAYNELNSHFDTYWPQ